MTAYVALLRAVNLGGLNRVSMERLRSLFEELGFPGARSLLQSGNLVFESGGRKPAELERLLEEATRERLGVSPDYFVRSSTEWSKIVAANPFRKEAKADPALLVVVCLKKAPGAGDVKSLQATIRGPEIVR